VKFGDRVYYQYLHHLNSKSTFLNKKKAIFIKQEGKKVWVVCEGNKTITKTTVKNIGQ